MDKIVDLSNEQTYKIVNFILKNRQFTQKEVIDKSRVSKGWVSKVFRRLESKGYIKKKNSKYSVQNPVDLISLFNLFRSMENNLIESFSLKPKSEALMRELIKRKVVFCTTTALQEYSSYYKDPSINFYSEDRKLLEELRTESKGLTRVNAYKPDLCLEIDIEKKGKMLLTSKVRTIIDLFCNNQAYTSKELIEKMFGERIG
ncbi:MAG: helix-turn-helix domain-containing protein [archaeon]